MSGNIWFVGEQLDADPAQLIEHHAARHFRRAHEREPQPVGEEHADLDVLAHHEPRRNYVER